MCGGDKELYERAMPLLDVVGKAKIYLGPVSLNLLSILLRSSGRSIASSQQQRDSSFWCVGATRSCTSTQRHCSM